MTDSAPVTPPFSKELSMSVVGYTVSCKRGLIFVEHFEDPPELVMKSSATLNLDVQGATVEHHDNKPIKLAAVTFGEGPFDPDRAGRLHDFGTGISIVANLPQADFPAFWAALSLEREATLVCAIALGTDDVGTDRVLELVVGGRRS